MKKEVDPMLINEALDRYIKNKSRLSIAVGAFLVLFALLAVASVYSTI